MAVVIKPTLLEVEGGLSPEGKKDAQPLALYQVDENRELARKVLEMNDEITHEVMLEYLRALHWPKRRRYGVFEEAIETVNYLFLVRSKGRDYCVEGIGGYYKGCGRMKV